MAGFGHDGGLTLTRMLDVLTAENLRTELVELWQNRQIPTRAMLRSWRRPVWSDSTVGPAQVSRYGLAAS
jgi:hypothetical protein